MKQVQHSKAFFGGAVLARFSVISITNVRLLTQPFCRFQVMYAFTYKEALCASCGEGGRKNCNNPQLSLNVPV